LKIYKNNFLFFYFIFKKIKKIILQKHFSTVKIRLTLGLGKVTPVLNWNVKRNCTNKWDDHQRSIKSKP